MEVKCLYEDSGADNRIRTGTPNLEGWCATITPYLHIWPAINKLLSDLNRRHASLRAALPAELSKKQIMSWPLTLICPVYCRSKFDLFLFIKPFKISINPQFKYLGAKNHLKLMNLNILTKQIKNMRLFDTQYFRWGSKADSNECLTLASTSPGSLCIHHIGLADLRPLIYILMLFWNCQKITSKTT